MKISSVILAFLLISSLACQNKTVKSNFDESLNSTDTIKDKLEIQKLISDAMHWANSQNSFDFLPGLLDKKDSIYIGFDLNLHKNNIAKISKTGYFSKEFIENYDRLILALDKNLKEKVYSPWRFGELPTFGFANDVNPWCDCQETPDGDTIRNNLSIFLIKLNKDRGEFMWSWKIKAYDNFKFKFIVVKTKDHWQISYLPGFDYYLGVKSE
jgi:hypothetical protein